MDLHDKLELVKDRDSFLDFVEALESDRRDSVAKETVSPSSPYGPDANGWENTAIETFLEAACRWAESSIGKEYVPDEPSWQAFATFLYMGKIYE